MNDVSKYHSEAEGPAASTVVCAFNYLTALVKPSLYRNGKVFTRRDREDTTTPPDAPERWSIEVRCVALYE